MDERPIGVFDSGIGGLTVVKALRDLLPDEKIFYLGDTARVPYGGKSASTVERYSLEIADILIEKTQKSLWWRATPLLLWPYRNWRNIFPWRSLASFGPGRVRQSRPHATTTSE